jgi:hypothetical protein
MLMCQVDYASFLSLLLLASPVQHCSKCRRKAMKEDAVSEILERKIEQLLTII